MDARCFNHVSHHRICAVVLVRAQNARTICGRLGADREIAAHCLDLSAHAFRDLHLRCRWPAAPGDAEIYHRAESFLPFNLIGKVQASFAGRRMAQVANNWP
jgi:hypothetical protein